MAEHIYGLTDVGKVRQNNEDTFVATFSTDEKYIIACVIDGVGGYAGGEIAAEIARKAILDHLATPQGEIVDHMKQAIHQANNEIYEERQRNKDYDSMACVLTLAVADLDRNQLRYAHVGDTRLYLLRDGSLVKITSDHSFVGFMEETGRISEESAMRHPKRNEINKALGFSNSVHTDGYIEFGESPFLPGDTILLCSDGLTDMVGTGSIQAIVSATGTLEKKAHDLVAMANQNGGKDNITVVLASNPNSRPEQQATKPGDQAKKKPQRVAKPLVDAVPPPVVQSPEKKDIPPAQVNQKAPKTPVSQVSRKPKRSIWPLISLFLFILVVYLLWKIGKTGQQADEPASDQKASALEIKLGQLISGAQGDTVLLTQADFPEPIVINSAILISRNSLYLKAEGNQVLVADSNSNGAGLSISSSSKNVTLDGITFKNFNVAIQTASRGLSLKNVRFFNCSDAVRASYIFDEGRYVNGSNGVFQTDSLPAK